MLSVISVSLISFFTFFILEMPELDGKVTNCDSSELYENIYKVSAMVAGLTTALWVAVIVLAEIW